MEAVNFEKLVDEITDQVVLRLSQQLTGRQQQKPARLVKPTPLKRQTPTTSQPLIIRELSFENLVHCMQFTPVTKKEEEIVAAIKAGQAILIVKEGRGYLPLLASGKYGLKKKIQEMETDFYHYGGTFITKSELEALPDGKQKQVKKASLATKRYVTAQDLLAINVQPHEVIYLPTATKLTDYAKEVIKEKDIKIIPVTTK